LSMHPRMSEHGQEQAPQQDDLALLGLDPAQPRSALNLAGADDPLPTPDALTNDGEPQAGDLAGNPVEIVAPTFTAPDMSQPQLQGSAGLTNDGITWLAGEQVDPALPDLEQYAQPFALDIYSSSSANPNADEPWLSDILLDGQVPALETEDGAEALDVLHGQAHVADPLLAELQPPQLEPEVRMDDHPGSLADDALSDLHASPDYQDLPYGVTMNNNNLLQPGSTRRTRHEALQFLGLDAQPGNSQ
jgi:hypothetical protein